jgi:peptide/nickel transport system substrate-binding protein
MSRKRLLGSCIITLCLLGSLAWPASGTAGEIKKGGSFRLAVHQRPPTMDWQFTSAESTRRIAIHVYENLFTVDDQGAPIRQLAESYKVSPDGLTYTVALRKGVLFHNGKEMKAEDVKASFDRFKKIGVRRGEFGALKQVDVIDDSTVAFRLAEPIAAFIDMLAYPMATPAIMPKAIADTAEGGKAEIIGTGPFKLVEWIADKHVKLVRFDGYKPDTRYQKPMGFGGKRTAYLNEIYFPLIEEVGAREGALLSNEVQGIISIAPPSAKKLAENKNLNLVEVNPSGKTFIMFNHAKWPTKEPKFREAVTAALNMEEIMAVAGDGVYQLSPGLLFPGTKYYTDAGKEFYNQKNPAKAKRLLAEMGYKGQEIVYIAAPDLQQGYKAAIVVAQQLKDVGINLKMESYDFGTAMGVRGQQDKWELFHTGQIPEATADPLPWAAWFHSSRKWGFYGDPKMDELVHRLNQNGQFEKRFEAFKNMQEYMWKSAAFLPLGNYGSFDGYQQYVKTDDIKLNFWIPRLWNVWLDK